MKLNLQKLAELERKWKTTTLSDPEFGDFTTDCESSTFDFTMNALHAYYLNPDAEADIIDALRPVYDQLEEMGVLEGVDEAFSDDHDNDNDE